MHYLHERSIAHMDLKPHNLLLTNSYRPTLKVADFGFAQHIDFADADNGDQSYRGSLLYMAPEVFKRQPYDARVDLWSTGVILFECLYGRAPFASDTQDVLAAKIRADTPIDLPARQPPLSDACVDLLRRLLQRDPRQRIAFDDFFNHPYVDIARAPSAQSLATAEALNRQADRVRVTGGDAADAVRLYAQV